MNAVEIRGLVKRFGQVTAVDGLDLIVREGECFGLLGPNGAGKTTTIEILEGLETPSAGIVEVLGRNWRQHDGELRGRIGVQLQESHFFDRLTVLETLRLFRSFYAHGPTAEEALAWVQLESRASVRVSHLSGGQRQRLALAVALAGDPELLFLDEPTTGLDPYSRRSLWGVIAGLRSRKRTVLLTTHYLEEAEKLCDRVAILDRGSIVAEGPPAALIAQHVGESVVEFEAGSRADRSAFTRVPGLLGFQVHGETTSVSVKQLEPALPALFAATDALAIPRNELTTRRATLDDVFLAVTGRAVQEEPA